MQVGWEVFGPQITIQLAGQMGKWQTYNYLFPARNSLLKWCLVLADNAYMSFGLSGAVDRSQMMGADVAVAYMDGFRGYATDYNITALSPVSVFLPSECYFVCFTQIIVTFFCFSNQCIKVLGQHKGVCRDDLIGGLDDNQLHTAERVEGVTYITYRRTLMSGSV